VADDILLSRLRNSVCWYNFQGTCFACEAADEIERLRAVLDAINALPSQLHDDDSQSLAEAVEDCWGNSDDVAYAGWKIGYNDALVEVWRILLPDGQQ
jgi:hypothetical protein